MVNKSETGVVNYDVIADERDVALLFRADVLLENASLGIDSQGRLKIIYANGKVVQLAECSPSALRRLKILKNVMCVNMSADKASKPTPHLLSIVRIV